MKRFTSKTQKIGKLGEDIACKHLEYLGHNIAERNYGKRFGEIDIISTKDRALYFHEVKSTSRRQNKGDQDPAFNITKSKIRKCETTIMNYLSENSVSHETNWEFWAIIVYIESEKDSKIRVYKNIY